MCRSIGAYHRIVESSTAFNGVIVMQLTVNERYLATSVNDTITDSSPKSCLVIGKNTVSNDWFAVQIITSRRYFSVKPCPPMTTPRVGRRLCVIGITVRDGKTIHQEGLVHALSHHYGIGIITDISGCAQVSTEDGHIGFRIALRFFGFCTIKAAIKDQVFIYEKGLITVLPVIIWPGRFISACGHPDLIDHTFRLINSILQIGISILPGSTIIGPSSVCFYINNRAGFNDIITIVVNTIADIWLRRIDEIIIVVTITGCAFHLFSCKMVVGRTFAGNYRDPGSIPVKITIVVPGLTRKLEFIRVITIRIISYVIGRKPAIHYHVIRVTITITIFICIVGAGTHLNALYFKGTQVNGSIIGPGIAVKIGDWSTGQRTGIQAWRAGMNV